MEPSPDSTLKARLEELLLGLQRLDIRLAHAEVQARTLFGPDAMRDPFRGLRIQRDDVDRLLARPAIAPTLAATSAEAEGEDTAAHSPFPELETRFGLSGFDCDVLLLAIAPELDLRYERIFAFLQDDVARRRPTVELALNLFCASAAEKLARRSHFLRESPLIRHGLVHLVAAPDDSGAPLLARFLKPDEQVVHFLLGELTLHPQLAGFCTLSDARGDEWPSIAGSAPELLALMREAYQDEEPLRLYFEGAPGSGQREAASSLAYELGCPLLSADLSRAPRDVAELEAALLILFRQARLSGSVLHIEGLDTFRESQAAVSCLFRSCAESGGIVIFSGARPWVPSPEWALGVMTISFPPPGVEQREALWRTALGEAGEILPDTVTQALAVRFELGPEQIRDASLSARARRRAARPESGDDVAELARDLFAAARSQTGHGLAEHATRISPRASWSDIVLPDDSLAQLREFCQRVVLRERVMDSWGFRRKLSTGRGTNALFSGASGTGKTMAAEVVARELGLDLFKIDLSTVVSKYIGETERNLDRVFTAAQHANAVLFFDEADALFGKRSEVSDAHDRYANIEVSFLLQKIEAYEGAAILATNLRQNVDEAFLRRLAFIVHFPFPDETSRQQIWKRVWPAEVPLAGDVRLDQLARQFKLSGGNIKNIALAACFLAAEEGGAVTMDHLLHAIRREYQKLGKVLSEQELRAAS